MIKRPASFISMQISGKYKLIMKHGVGTCLHINLLTKSIFSMVIAPPNFKKLFSEKNGLE